jgi:serine/threonine protein kinase
MEPASAHAGAPAPNSFTDGLGVRRRTTDPARHEPIELLCLRGELTAVPSFEFALRERVSHLSVFRRACYAHVRSVERLKSPPSALVLVSDVTQGVRLSDLLAFAENATLPLDIDAALCLLRQIVPAVAMLHEQAPDVAHGAIAPERIVVTPTARIVMVEHVLGAALNELQFTRERYWKELRVALPGSSGPASFNHRSDVTQLGVVALSLIVGRPLADDELPWKLGEVVASSWAISARGGLEPLPAGLRGWLMRALQLDPRESFASAVEAHEDLERMLGDSDYLAAPTSLEAFLGHYRAETGSATTQSAWVGERASDPVRPSDAAPVTRPIEAVLPPPAARVNPSDRPASAPEAERSSDAKPTPAPYTLPASAFTPSAFTAPSTIVTPPVAAGMPASPTQARPEPYVAAQPADQKPAVQKPIDLKAESTPAEPPASEYRPGERTPIEPPSAMSTTFNQPRDTARPPAPAVDFSSTFDEPAPSRAQTPRKWWLAAAAVVVLGLAGIALPAARRLVLPGARPAAEGTLSVTTNPPGARLFVDGVDRGATPLSVALKPGPHSLEVRGDGKPRLMPITITAGSQVSQYLDLPTAAAAVGQLRVRTEPAGARVSVDGVVRGAAPVTVAALAPGDHQVVVESDLGSVKQMVVVEAGMTASLTVPLGAPEGAPVSGWLTISAPAELQIFENRRLIGTSQTERVMVSAGRHELELLNEALGYRAVRTVQVAAGKVTSVKVEFPKGTIALNAIPWAEVWVDGEKIGETPIGNLPVTIGTHDIVFRNPDLGEQRHKATVTLSAPARLSVDLRKK